MIPVTPQPEPATFQQLVGEPGQKALDAGKVPLPSYWTECLPDLLSAYDRICAYSCHYIPPITGGHSVEHFAPKSADPADTYKWANYRLVCSLMNSRKREFVDVLDPFEIEDGWFELEFVFFQVRPAAHLPAHIHAEVAATIKRLRLAQQDSSDAHQRMYDDWLEFRHCDSYMQRYAPFLFREAVRQGRHPLTATAAPAVSSPYP